MKIIDKLKNKFGPSGEAGDDAPPSAGTTGPETAAPTGPSESSNDVSDSVRVNVCMKGCSLNKSEVTCYELPPYSYCITFIISPCPLFTLALDLVRQKMYKQVFSAKLF